MPKTVDYYFATASPWSYLGHSRFMEIAGKYGAEVNHIPIDAMPVFDVSGGLPLPKRAVQRQAYRLAELKRWRAHLDIPLNLEPKYFPNKQPVSNYAIIACIAQGADPGELVHGIMTAVWAEDRDIDDPETLRRIAQERGYDNLDFLQRLDDAGVHEKFNANTRQAIERQVFGMPTYIIGGELFWGQDRLDFVERALQA